MMEQLDKEIEVAKKNDKVLKKKLKRKRVEQVSNPYEVS